MGCIFTFVAAVVPRILVLAGWYNDQAHWQSAFASPIWLLLGFLFMPWTTFCIAIFGPGGFTGFAVLFTGLAVVLDLGTWGGGFFANREQVSNFR